MVMDQREETNEVVISQSAGVLLPGSVFESKYEVLAQLNDGEVFKCNDQLMNREVVVKILDSHSPNSEKEHERLVCEAQVLTAFSHPSVVAVYSFGLSEGRPFLVMPYLEGESLAKLLSTDRKLDAIRVVRIFHSIGEGLAALHARGIIHRNLKPGNIIVPSNDDGDSVIIGFDLAKSALDAGSSATIGTKNLLSASKYCSPEQCSQFCS